MPTWLYIPLHLDHVPLKLLLLLFFDITDARTSSSDYMKTKVSSML